MSFTLTAAIDAAASFTGNKGDDIFTATSATLSAFDSIDGGAGAGDTLNISALTAAGFDSTTIGGLTVKSVEVVNINSVGGIKADVTTWGTTNLNAINVTAGDVVLTAANTTNVVTANSFLTGDITVSGGASQTASVNGGDVTLSGSVGAVAVTGANMGGSLVSINGGTSVSVTETGVGAGTLTIGNIAAPTGAVTVSSTTASGNMTQGAITVNGGSTVSVTTASGNSTVNTTAVQSAVTVNGSALTTSVAVAAAATVAAGATKAGTTAGSVTIVDKNSADGTKADVITTVSLTNTGAATVTSSAVSTLNLAGSNSTVALNFGVTDAAANAKTLTVNATGTTSVGLINGTLAAGYTTVNVNATGTTTIADVSLAAATALNVAGAGKVNFTANTGIAAVTAITVGDGGSSFGTQLGNNVVFTAGAGNDTVILGATTKAINLGAGTNSVTLNAAAVTGSITAGAGTADSLTLNATDAATASGSAVFAGKVSGFENLVLTGSVAQVIDVAALGNYTKVSTSAGNGLTLNNAASGSTLTLTGAGTAYTVANSNFVLGTADVLNVALTDGSGAGVGFGAITAANVETINVTTADTSATPAGVIVDSLTLTAAGAKSISVSGNAGLALTAGSTLLTSVDASGITLGGFSFTSAALAAAATIKGSATGANTVTFSAAGDVVTYVGGSGADTIVGANGKANIVTLGNGTNSFTGAAGNMTITGGTGADTVVVTTGNNTVSLGDGANSFTATTGKNVFTGGANVDTVIVGGGGNTISTLAGNDLITIGASSASTNSVNVGTGTDTVTISAAPTAAGFYVSLAGMGGGDIINVSAVDGVGATEAALGAKITLGASATFANYLDAASAGGATGAVNWFTLNGNTYITVDNSASTTFADGVDTVIELVGTVDLSTAGNALGIITLGGPTT